MHIAHSAVEVTQTNKTREVILREWDTMILLCKVSDRAGGLAPAKHEYLRKCRLNGKWWERCNIVCHGVHVEKLTAAELSVRVTLNLKNDEVNRVLVLIIVLGFPHRKMKACTVISEERTASIFRVTDN